MRLAVRTDELRAAAQQLADAADRVGRLTAALDAQRPGVAAWATGRARTRADAFLATLLDEVRSGAEELDDLALWTTVAAQDYEDAESSALPRPR